VPGNLVWASPKEQSQKKNCKIIGELQHRIKQLEAEVAFLKAA